MVDQIFSTPPALLTVGAAWLGIVAFFFQIYFDFSGYSDMAIGLGSIFGFKFRENFRYPYVARSITAFWQRWHISLTTWLRDYIYRPLHHSNSSWLGRSINVYIVFTLCGLWHGANWTFIIFGLYFGTLLVLEHYYWRRFGAHWPRPLQHIYVILACLIALVFFRSLNITYAWHYLRAMFNFVGHQSLEFGASQLLTSENIVVLATGAIFSTPIIPYIQRIAKVMADKHPSNTLKSQFVRGVYSSTAAFALLILLTLSILGVSKQAYQPFIYFQF